MTNEVRAISSVISDVICRWCMFLSCPLRVQRGCSEYRNRLRRGEGYKALVGVRSNYCVLDGYLLNLSWCRSGFQDLIRVRPSSFLMFCGYLSISIASLMSRFTYLVLTERSFVSCSLMMWSWLMVCSTTADLFRKGPVYARWS